MKQGEGMKAEFSGSDFWKNYMVRWFGKELIDKWAMYAELVQIDSAGGKINAEVYRNTDSGKPVIVFAHGIAGYARVLLPFLIPLYEKGYNIVTPDLEGFGYNGRIKGDYTWNTHLRNLKDTVDYARSQFQGPVFLGGASMGGPLAYAADARYNCADALICWCLWNLSDREFLKKETTTKGLTPLLLPLFRLAASVFGKLRVKTYSFISYDTLTDSSEFNNLLKTDPQAGTSISLRGALSLVTQAVPDIMYENYSKPVLLCQPEGDRMIPPVYSRRTFGRLKSEQKKYYGFEGPHFPLEKKIYSRWADCVDRFIEEYGNIAL